MSGLNKSARITKLQIAKGSAWESCVSVTRRSLIAHICDDIKVKCAGGTGEIGIEAFFDESGSNEACPVFCGLRLSLPDNGIAVLMQLVSDFIGSEKYLAGDFICFFEKKLGKALFRGEPDFMELGLINKWKSFGGMVFRQHQKTSHLTAFSEELKRCGRFNGSLEAPPAIEFGYSEPVPHWLGFSVAEQGSSGDFRLDHQKAALILSGRV